MSWTRVRSCFCVLWYGVSVMAAMFRELLDAQQREKEKGEEDGPAQISVLGGRACAGFAASIPSVMVTVFFSAGLGWVGSLEYAGDMGSMERGRIRAAQ